MATAKKKNGRIIKNTCRAKRVNVVWNYYQKHKWQAVTKLKDTIIATPTNQMYTTFAITALVTILGIVLQDLFTLNKYKNRKGKWILFSTFWSFHHAMEWLEDRKNWREKRKSIGKIMLL